MYAAIIIILITLGSLVVFAEEAEPNDRLYQSVKINITEKTGQVLGQFSEKIDIEWQVQLAERRLREVQALILEGDITPELLADLRIRYRVHAERLEALLLAQEKEGSAALAAEFASFAESRTSAFQEVLEVLVLDLDPTLQPQVLAFVEDVEGVRGNLTGIVDRIEADISNLPNIERAARDRARGARTEADISERRFDQRRLRLDEAEQAFIQSELDQSIAAIEDGKVLLKEEKYPEAFVRFQEADRFAQRVEIFADAARVVDLR